MNAKETYRTYRLKVYFTLLDKEYGRTKPIQNGYRPSISFSNSKRYFSGEIHLIGSDILQPSQSAYAIIKLLPAKTIPKSLEIGNSFTLFEGKKIVGSGVIVDNVSNVEAELITILTKS